MFQFVIKYSKLSIILSVVYPKYFTGLLYKMKMYQNIFNNIICQLFNSLML